MNKIVVNPFTKDGRTLYATEVRHKPISDLDGDSTGSIISFSLIAEKKTHVGKKVVLVPSGRTRETEFRLDFLPDDSPAIVSLRSRIILPCESPLYSNFLLGGKVFVDHFWNTSKVSDSDRNAMRIAISLMDTESVNFIDIDSNYMKTKVFALYWAMIDRLEDSKTLSATLKVRLASDCKIFREVSNDFLQQTGVYSKGTIIEVCDPELSEYQFLTEEGANSFVPCYPIAGGKQCFYVLLDELSFSFEQSQAYF